MQILLILLEKRTKSIASGVKKENAPANGRAGARDMTSDGVMSGGVGLQACRQPAAIADQPSGGTSPCTIHPRR